MEEKKDFMFQEVTSTSGNVLPILRLFLPWKETSCPTWKELDPLSPRFHGSPALGPCTPMSCPELCPGFSPPALLATGEAEMEEPSPEQRKNPG